MIHYNDEEEALLGLVQGPVWPDLCEHSSEQFIASFEVLHFRKGQPAPARYDLYLFEQHGHGQEVCIRYGNEWSEYISPGFVGSFLLHANGEDKIYNAAAKILLHFGRVTWALKPVFQAVATNTAAQLP